MEVPLFPVRLDVRDDDATATVELVATAFVEADDETYRKGILSKKIIFGGAKTYARPRC